MYLFYRLLSNDPSAGLPQGAPILGGIVGGEEPSRYSQSPALWNRLFDYLGIAGRYTTFDLPDADKMEEFINEVFSLPHFIDLTVTNPYKALAYSVLPSLPGKIKVTERARILKSLNHLTRNPISGETLADTTDGQGMTRALKKRTSLRGKKAVLAGAGGAALSIGYELLLEGADVVIVNIVAEDGQRLAEFLGSCPHGGGQICALPWEARGNASFSADIVVSAVSAGTFIDSAALGGLPEHCICADARYGEKAEFVHVARLAGRSCVDGREMLYGQFRVAAETLSGLGGASSDSLGKALDDVESWFCPS
jgi:shikimate dehydrogenase